MPIKTIEIEAKKLALEQLYNVKVAIVDDVNLCYTDQHLLSAYKQNLYYICSNDLDKSVNITETLIRFKQIGNKCSVQRAAEALIEKADLKSLEIGGTIKTIRQDIESLSGKSASLRMIAEKLNQASILTPNGKEKWHAQSVRSIEKRYQKLIIK